MAWCIGNPTFNPIIPRFQRFWLRGGPRRQIYMKPNKTKVAIVTCGGLCPGLNVVIREVIMALNFNYNVSEIWGVKYDQGAGSTRAIFLKLAQSEKNLFF